MPTQLFGSSQNLNKESILYNNYNYDLMKRRQSSCLKGNLKYFSALPLKKIFESISLEHFP